MSKYDKFASFLSASHKPEIRLTFAEIEAILGFPLPASKSYQAWWSNNPWNNVMTKVWLDAGFKSSQVDIAGEQVVFVRDTMAEHVAIPIETAQPAVPRSPLFGLMKGTSIIAPGVDLTEPADPDWGKVYDDDYVPPSAKLVVEDRSLSISDKIRELNEMGVSRAQIARLLGKRYQHVRNVLTADARKAG
ncbi:hypothetical protein [Devosia sp. Root635]|uniref:DUF7662 domain-containing protein n=1 Tax=Devosia sp. Root635 TaxID=1736575 RepID=UPI0006FF7B86|nr:hypothetical protein [Devosia sp. Root635]KRA42210.1 hypothetical protein ASD80_10870 [Devosia sp. Root635]